MEKGPPSTTPPQGNGSHHHLGTTTTFYANPNGMQNPDHRLVPEIRLAQALKAKPTHQARNKCSRLIPKTP